MISSACLVQWVNRHNHAHLWLHFRYTDKYVYFRAVMGFLSLSILLKKPRP